MPDPDTLTDTYPPALAGSERLPDFGGRAPEWARDIVYLETDIKFDLRDRLRILFNGRVSVNSFTYVQNSPGQLATPRIDAITKRILPRLRREPEQAAEAGANPAKG